MEDDLVTFDQVIEAEKPAFYYREGGGVLRYEPLDGSVRVLAFPGTPEAWKEAAEYLRPIPERGWGHRPGCGCTFCVVQLPGWRCLDA